MRARPRILVDARKARDFGIGRYVVGLLGGLTHEPLELLAIVRPGEEALLPEGVAPVLCGAGHYGLAELFAVRAAIRRVAPDLFHAPHYVVPLSPPKTTVVTIHDLMHLERPEHAGAKKRLYATVMLRRAVAGAARIVTVSEHTRRALAAFDGGSAEKSVTIPNGVDARFRSDVAAAERRRVRETHGVSAPYLLFVGNDKPHKNIDGHRDAFALHLQRAGGPHVLALAGGAPERAALRAEAVRVRGLDGRVHDLGIVPDEDVAPLMAEAAALALPSFAEGFGLPALEAQAVGTPVVCSDRGGLPEAAGDAALLVDPGDSAALADALGRILSDEALRHDLVARGLARAAAFRWPEIARRTRAVYEEALAG